MKKFLSRFNVRKWTFDGNKLANPIVIVWRLFMVIPYSLALLFFCAVYYLAKLDFQEAVEVWDRHSVSW